MSIDPSKASLTEMVAASFDSSNRKIKELEEENTRLKRENLDLKNRLANALRSISQRARDDREHVDIGGYDR